MHQVTEDLNAAVSVGELFNQILCFDVLPLIDGDFFGLACLRHRDYVFLVLLDVALSEGLSFCEHLELGLEFEVFSHQQSFVEECKTRERTTIAAGKKVVINPVVPLVFFIGWLRYDTSNYEMHIAVTDGLNE